MELGTGSQHLTTHHNHPEGWFKPESLIYSIWNRTWKLAFIPHSQVMLMLLIMFEQVCGLSWSLFYP